MSKSYDEKATKSGQNALQRLPSRLKRQKKQNRNQGTGCCGWEIFRNYHVRREPPALNLPTPKGIRMTKSLCALGSSALTGRWVKTEPGTKPQPLGDRPNMVGQMGGHSRCRMLEGGMDAAEVVHS